jgi:hypothetical protein
MFVGVRTPGPPWDRRLWPHIAYSALTGGALTGAHRSCVPRDAMRVRALEAAAPSDNCRAADANVSSERIVTSSVNNAAVITDDNELIKPVLDSLPDCVKLSMIRSIARLSRIFCETLICLRGTRMT